VPFAQEQVVDRRDTPSIALAAMAAGVEAAIAAAAQRVRDVRLAAGALD